MNKYPAYKDSGIEWIGNIPERWVIDKLKYISCVNLSNVDKKSEEGQPQVHLCNYTDVYYNDFITSDLDFMEATATPEQIEKFTLKKGDVLITKDSEEWDDIAVSAYVPTDYKNVLCGYHLAHIRPFEDLVNGRFLFRSFSAYPLCEQFKVSANGITRYGIGKYDIENALFILPATNEQQAIIDFLDKKTALIDGLIERKKRQIELLKEQRQAVIYQAVTKGLDPDVEMKDSGIEWLGKIPKHWKATKVKHEFLFLDNRRIPLSGEVRGAMTNKTYDYYGASGVIDKVDEYIFNETLILIGEDGANLYSRSKPLAFLASGKYWVNNHAHILKPKNGNMNYLVNLLEKMDYTPYVTGSAQPKLTIDNLANMSIPIPPINEQNEISTFLGTNISEIQNTIDKAEKQIELLQEYRTALISEAVTGKIDVREIA